MERNLLEKKDTDSLNNLEQIKNRISELVPNYWTGKTVKEIIETIRQEFPKSTNADVMYRQFPDTINNTFFQCDIVSELPFFRIVDSSPDLYYSDSIIISNSCDIQKHKRIYSPKVLFSKVITWNNYQKKLAKCGAADQSIQTFYSNLIKNQYTSFFYLPKLEDEDNKVILEESVIPLDHVSYIPSNDLYSMYSTKYLSDNDNGDKIVSLSNYGFYLFLMKLSVHFCRFGEKIDRNEFLDLS